MDGDKGQFREADRGGVRGDGLGDVCARLTSTGQVAGQSLVVHEHLAGGVGVGDGVLGGHVGAHNPEAAAQTHVSIRRTFILFLQLNF